MKRGGERVGRLERFSLVFPQAKRGALLSGKTRGLMDCGKYVYTRPELVPRLNPFYAKTNLPTEETTTRVRPRLS